MASLVLRAQAVKPSDRSPVEKQAVHTEGLVFSEDWTYRWGTCPPKSREEVAQVLFRTGERTWQAGIYRSGCCGFEIAIGKGGTFPLCRRCGLAAAWTLTKLTIR